MIEPGAPVPGTGEPAAPKPKTRRTLLWVAMGALALICLCSYLSFTASQPQDATRDDVTGVQAASRSIATAKPSPTTPPAVGDVVALGASTWRVTEAQALEGVFYGDQPDSEPLTTEGRFVRLVVEVGNTGGEPFSIPGIDLLDAAGRKFTHSSDAIWRIPNERLCGLETLNPGLTKTCELVFEVPADATGLQALVKEPGPFADRTAIDLGLP